MTIRTIPDRKIRGDAMRKELELTHEEIIWIIGALELKVLEVENDPDYDSESNEIATRQVTILLDAFKDLENFGGYPVKVSAHA